MAKVGAAEGQDVGNPPAGRDGNLHGSGAEAVRGVEVAVRRGGGQVDPKAEPYLMEGATDDTHGAALPGDQLVLPLPLVERPVREVGEERRVGAEAESVEQVRADRAVRQEREVVRQGGGPTHAIAGGAGPVRTGG